MPKISQEEEHKSVGKEDYAGLKRKRERALLKNNHPGQLKKEVCLVRELILAMCISIFE